MHARAGRRAPGARACGRKCWARQRCPGVRARPARSCADAGSTCQRRNQAGRGRTLVLVEGVGELVDGGGHLQTSLQDLALALQADVAWPADEAGHVHLGLRAAGAGGRMRAGAGAQGNTAPAAPPQGRPPTPRPGLRRTRTSPPIRRFLGREGKSGSAAAGACFFCCAAARALDVLTFPGCGRERRGGAVTRGPRIFPRLAAGRRADGRALRTMRDGKVLWCFSVGDRGNSICCENPGLGMFTHVAVAVAGFVPSPAALHGPLRGLNADGGALRARRWHPPGRLAGAGLCPRLPGPCRFPRRPGPSRSA